VARANLRNFKPARALRALGSPKDWRD
jgi:hypothetical protein